MRLPKCAISSRRRSRGGADELKTLKADWLSSTLRSTRGSSSEHRKRRESRRSIRLVLARRLVLGLESRVSTSLIQNDRRPNGLHFRVQCVAKHEIDMDRNLAGHAFAQPRKPPREPLGRRRPPRGSRRAPASAQRSPPVLDAPAVITLRAAPPVAPPAAPPVACIGGARRAGGQSPRR